MSNEILDKEFEELKKRADPIKRFSGLARFSLILYFMFLFSLIALMNLNGNLFFLTLPLISSFFLIYYNLKQGQYEFADRKIVKNKRLRNVSILGFAIWIFVLFVYQFLIQSIPVFSEYRYLESFALIVGLAFVIYRDVMKIPSEIIAAKNVNAKNES